MINHINQIAKLITEDPDIINNQSILRESIEKDIKKLLTRIKSKLNHDINIDEITKFSTQQQYKELGISKWLAKQIAFNPNLRVDWQSLTDYVKHIKLREPALYKSLFKKKLEEIEVESEEWHSQFQANDDAIMTNDEPIITQLPNGYKIVKLTTKEHCSAEGEAMGHCVGGYDPEVDDLYSLRDPRGRPHVTIQIEDGKINQIKGKENKPPVKKYAELVIPWVNSILKEPGKLFSNPDVNFTYYGFKDYLNSLCDEGLLRKFAKSVDSRVRWAVARNLNTPPDVLEMLANDNSDHVKKLLANNPNTPPNILRKMFNDISKAWIKRPLAKNPSTPPDILKLLSTNIDIYIRTLVAKNLNTPIDVLRFLAYDYSVNVRHTVSDNPNTPVDVLKLLIDDESFSVRRAVPGNPNISIDLLTILAKDEDDYIRYQVAKNPNTPLNILRSLANDDNNEGYVRIEANNSINKRNR